MTHIDIILEGYDIQATPCIYPLFWGGGCHASNAGKGEGLGPGQSQHGASIIGHSGSGREAHGEGDGYQHGDGLGLCTGAVNGDNDQFPMDPVTWLLS